MLFLPQMNFHTTRGLNFKNHFKCIQNFMLFFMFSSLRVALITSSTPRLLVNHNFPLSRDLLNICCAPVSGKVLQDISKSDVVCCDVVQISHHRHDEKTSQQGNTETLRGKRQYYKKESIWGQERADDFVKQESPLTGVVNIVV